MTILTIDTNQSDIFITWDDVPPEIANCSHPGNCDQDVADFIACHGVKVIGDGGLAQYLREYGAWSDKQLEDESKNLERLVWIISADLEEYGEAYLSNY